jgi:hypothetical protein
MADPLPAPALDRAVLTPVVRRLLARPALWAPPFLELSAIRDPERLA